MELIFNERIQYLVYFGLSIFAIVLTIIGYFYNNQLFTFIIGEINPIISGILIIFFGFILLSYLLSKSYFAIYKKGDVKRLFYSSGLAVLFGLIIIVVDYSTRIYSKTMNVSFPLSLLLYPAVAFYVEILLQVLPFIIILVVLTSFLKNRNYEKMIWINIFIASFVEPIYQAISLFSVQIPLWFIIFTFMHVFLIVLSQLIIFKHYDFVTMYWFRINYYFIWHIIWGYFRLQFLF